jgi:DNA-directed RNA polymerase subunit beta'
MNTKSILERFRENIKVAQFNAIKISLASPEEIKAISYGQIEKIETINYRTLKPEKGGLFCPRIFGPTQDWTCVCGKYKRMKYRGIICERCGVEVIEARVRRERMGHIELASPVVHVWYLKNTPSYLSLILDITVKLLERVIYFDAYIVIAQGNSPYPVKTIISFSEYLSYKNKHADDIFFEVGTGAEAIKKILEKIDLELEVALLQEEYKKTSALIAKLRIMKRIRIFTNFLSSKTRPEWMILSVLPVLPPDLRPLVPLEGGRFASSDLNELYRRIINRDIRLKRLIEIQAPNIIIKNEKRMLQESVDALIDNGRRTQPVKMNKRPLKSLSGLLCGKFGRFRQNLLGKRVDYSARSVIVVDPELKIDQCSIPKLMALELFKSNVIHELIKREIVPNVRVARKYIEEKRKEAWDVLEDIVYKYPVMLNRAPTLHRLGIQAFEPKLGENKAIGIHPLVTTAFNADFDGDQMGVYIPLNKNAIQECKKLIMSSANLLSPQNGKPVMIPHQEMVLGLYYLSNTRKNMPGEGMVFSNVQEVILAYEVNKVSIHAIIKVRIDNKIIETGVGRVILYSNLPEGSDFEWVDQILDKSDLARLVEKIYFKFGNEKTIIALDKIKKLGFHFVTRSGITFSYNYLINPTNAEKIIQGSEDLINSIDSAYNNGQITLKERSNKILQVWDDATTKVADDMMNDFKKWNSEVFLNSEGEAKEFNFLSVALDSKSRGSKAQVKQLIGMRGLMAKPSGEIIETPIKSNFKKGLSVFEYFTSTHGARKGQADTALKTANAGYLTRRLVDVAQDVIVTIVDCGSTDYLEFEPLTEKGEVLTPLIDRVYGKIVACDVVDLLTNTVVLKAGTLIGKDEVVIIKNSFVQKIKVRSVTKCKARYGVCSFCYGMDLSKDSLAQIGSPVGIIAAQSIGEPGTQLTLRTFHIGGTANLSEQSFFEAKYSGRVFFENTKTIKNTRALFL